MKKISGKLAKVSGHGSKVDSQTLYDQWAGSYNTELINEYGSLEDLLTNAENIKQNKRRENIIDFSDNARLSYKLALLDISSPIITNIDDLENIPINYEKIISFSREMELTNLINRIDNSFSQETQKIPSPELLPNINKEKNFSKSSINNAKEIIENLEITHDLKSIEEITSLSVNQIESLSFRSAN